MSINDKQELISVILPVYNGEMFLTEAIESVLQQTYRNLELIIVNDCSTDRSQKIAEYFQQRDSRIRLIFNPKNHLLPESLNIGHRAAKGEYITWTSDDNIYNENALKSLYNYALKSQADIVYSNFQIIEKNGKIRRSFFINPNSSLLLSNTVGCCFLYRMDVYRRNLGYNPDLHTAEDYDFWLRSSIHSRRIHIPEILYKYRSHDNSLSYSLQCEDSLAKQNFNLRLKKSYESFFGNLSIDVPDDYLDLFVQLHTRSEINIVDFLKNSKSFNHLIKEIFSKSKFLNKNKFISSLDLKILENIKKYSDNQSTKTILYILLARPTLILKQSIGGNLKMLYSCLSK